MGLVLLLCETKAERLNSETRLKLDLIIGSQVNDINEESDVIWNQSHDLKY